MASFKFNVLTGLFDLVGTSGGGGGDVNGPGSSSEDDIVTFADNTGKNIKDSGVKVSDLLAVANNLSDVASPAAAKTNISPLTQVALDYTVLTSDDFIEVTDTSSPRTITLPSSPPANKEFTVKDGSGLCSINNITIECAGGVLMDGAAQQFLNEDYDSFSFKWTGTQYFIF